MLMTVAEARERAVKQVGIATADSLWLSGVELVLKRLNTKIKCVISCGGIAPVSVDVHRKLVKKVLKKLDKRGFGYTIKRSRKCLSKDIYTINVFW